MSTQTPDLRTAAQAVIDRWETPLWKDAPATAGYIAALRDALAADHTGEVTDMVGRWYMVNRDGMATLCTDRTDAEKEAADAQSVWPHMGPHRAVQLVEASFEAADMATARAQGFRDGAASVAASAGSEPVAPAAVAGPSDEMVLAAARVLSPGLFRYGLDPQPKDGPHTTSRMRKEAELVRRMLEAALAAAPTTQPAPQQESQEPEVWRLVPADATDDMMAAFAKAAAADMDWHSATEADRQEVRDGFCPAYRAMLKAAPQPSPTAQKPATSAAATVGEVPLPLLVRDIAADLGTTPIQVCTALAKLGFGGHSVNMAVTPRMAQSLRAHFASPTAQAESQPALDHIRTRIREIFMAHAFTVKEGQTDLTQYVYDAADALLRAARAPADSVPTAQFDDPKVQVVYAILCDDADPPKGEHWEGFAARRIVDALSADSVLEDAARLWDAFVEEWRNEAGADKIVNIMGGADKLKAVFLDAARKQGGA